ncbi:hypothetical protein ABIC56_001030 [Acinetobacter bereziniae]|nr:hypothetical protein [Acinetobacter bereziniae]
MLHLEYKWLYFNRLFRLSYFLVACDSDSKLKEHAARILDSLIP